MKFLKIFILFCVLVLARNSFALGQIQYVETAPSKNCFPIVQKNSTAEMLVDTNDFTGVLIAANNLQTDISNVTGKTPQLFQSAIGNRQSAIIIGTIGKSELIDRLISEKKIDVSQIAGKWESFFLQTVSNPFPGIKNALVICGSDKRGTIYGIYDLSEEIGVSPWHFWTDTPPKHHDELFVRAGKFVQGPPAVKYRGIFLNDEAPDLTDWANEKFGGYNHAFYTNIFDLLLRLKANYLWPAMWNNAFNEDDPLNPKLANDYGIVMGTSHVEPMMRADKEWSRAGYTASEWNYATHPTILSNFWREGIERNDHYESVITVGMRGKTDSPMAGVGNLAGNILLLEKVVADQRKIISEVLQTNAADVPQDWAIYKEVQNYYDHGARVPDDVTLLWSDDNWGDLRRVPTPDERKRSGGAGIYYHLDYVGGPRNYKWVNSTQIAKIWEQMNLAYNYGARRIWIVNVGHLQHVAFPTEFFLNMAWNPNRWNQNNISDFTELWAQREFGKQFAPQIADIVSKYTKYNARRKPELLSPETFSLTNYHEADRVLADWKKISDEAENISKQLPADERDAFFLTILYPTKASAIVNELYIDAAKNHFYAAQNDPRANFYADEVKRLFQTDADLSDYYNHQLAGGKWDHMADQTHIGYTRWQQPPENVMPKIFEIKTGSAPVSGTNAAGFSNSGKSSAQTVRREDAPNGDRDGRATESEKGFIESDGYVSMDAGHFTINVPAKNARWEKIPDLGRTDSAMSIFPVTAPSVTPPGLPRQNETTPGNSPRLEYKMFLFDAGKIQVETLISPTLNFVAGRGLRFAISFDDEPSKIVTAVPENYSAGDGNHDWEKTVENSAREITTDFDLQNPGEHTLKIWMVDPGIVLQKIIVNCGGEKSSYLGPPESFRNPPSHKW